MFRYNMHYANGSDAGDAAYADSVNVGEEVLIGKGERLPSARRRRDRRDLAVPDG
jgi:hypothetical protein